MRKPLKENISFLKEKNFPLRKKIKILKGKYHISSIPIFRAFEKIEMNIELYLHHYQVRELDDAFDFQSSIVPVLDEKLQPIW